MYEGGDVVSDRQANIVVGRDVTVVFGVPLTASLAVPVVVVRRRHGEVHGDDPWYISSSQRS